MVPYVNHSRWLVRRQPLRDRARRRWVIFPYAGAGPSAFYSWAQHIPEPDDVLIVHLPGRERRFDEPATNSLDTVVQAVTQDLERMAPAPTLFFGYSLGTLIAYEVGRMLRTRQVQMPDLFAVAAGSSPDNIQRRAPVHNLPGDAFWRKVMSYGGTSAELVAESELRAYAEPMLRADLQLIDEYRHVPREPFTAPIISIAGRHDQVCPPQYVRGWSSFTTGAACFQEINDAHFFLHTHSRELYEMINDFACAELFTAAEIAC